MRERPHGGSVSPLIYIIGGGLYLDITESSSLATNSKIEKMLRKDLLQMPGYEPIIPPERFGAEVIKLDGNENSYGCSHRVQQALRNYFDYHIYPDPDQREVKQALEEYVGVNSNHIVVGNGSDELIDLVLRLTLEPGDGVINCVPTFGMYSFSTVVCGGRIIDVPRKQDFSLDIEEIAKFVDNRTKVIFIASPNNPTGNLTPREDILRLLEIGVIVVVDEAYYEFSGETVINLVPDNDNLIVLRTFSKWAGLAGLRAGYAVAPVSIARHIHKIKPPYNVNVAAQIAMLESLKDLEHLRQIVKAIIAERERLLELLTELPFLEPYPSQANFILCKVKSGSAREIYQQLREKGIWLRYFNTPLLKDYIRISVGKPEYTDILVDALTQLGNFHVKTL